MKDLRNDESGIAYGLYAIALFIFMGGVFIILMTNVFNGLLDPFNQFVAQGMVSQQTRDSMGFIISVIEAMLFFIVLGSALWGWIRALEKKQQEG